MVMDTTSSTGRWLSAERATKMFDRLTTLVHVRGTSGHVMRLKRRARLRDGSMDAAVPAQELGVTLRVLADGRGAFTPRRTSTRFMRKARKPFASRVLSLHGGTQESLKSNLRRSR